MLIPAHLRTQILHIEDVFILGFCGTDQLKLSLTHDEVSKLIDLLRKKWKILDFQGFTYLLTTDWEETVTIVRNSSTVHRLTPDLMDKMWRTIEG